MNIENKVQNPDNVWETYYSDDDDNDGYVETMRNLKIESTGVKMKGGKKIEKLEEQNSILNQQKMVDNFENIGDNFMDENNISNYSFDCSMISDINDYSFFTHDQNLDMLLNNRSCNTLQDEIDSVIDREALINPDTSLIAKTFFNSSEETDLSTILPQSVKESNSFISTVPTETTEPIEVSLTEKSEPNVISTSTTTTTTNNNNNNDNNNDDDNNDNNNNNNNNTHTVDNDSFNPMFINRISSFPIVQQSVQAIKNTSIGNLADRTIRRVASTRLPVINVPKLPSLPIIVGKKDKDENNKVEKSEPTLSSITLEDATKNLPGFATMDSLGCKTLDKLEENFPMINDPELLDKILNRLEELREIGENTYVIQSSLNSLQNMQTRLNRYNSVKVKGKHHNNSNKDSTIKHRHSFTVATTKTAAASATYHSKKYSASSCYHTSTTATTNASVETINGCCCCCQCHQQQLNNPSNIQRIIKQQQENLIKSSYQNSNNIHQSIKQQRQQKQQPSKLNFFLKHNEKPSVIKEIINIRSNLQDNIHSIPNAMYGRINNVLTAIEKKLLSGTDLEKEMVAKINNQENKGKIVTTDLIDSNDNNSNNEFNFLKDTNKFTEEPSSFTTITTTMTTSTSTTSTVTTTINSNINSNNDISSPLPSNYHNNRHNRVTSSDYETDSTLYSPSLSSVYSPRSLASSPFYGPVTPNLTPKTTIEMKDQDISPQIIHNMNNMNNNGGSNVHDLYSFLEEVNKLLSIYLITRKKTDQNVSSN